ncbi:hypothetical protein IMG5_125230 [Ichthyophthirius multifiliis]|uniref:Uncharacterized protein n=1 Tax=Ichthyophthirius multifiliis TaxID=5932 RepID=G0QVQ1_ICHMU|nr:hypothetical protein IMG5_125230 [Ichthyophthirius multifiliis]EGR30704.1 hypothetical protein IMG5_125230 [Ichthyophthirius multifiliis]|eukprot:XP_004032291.1 hypothetical protein IMG5_125230 [Ichthyophthirius multifiliis]
MSEKADIFAEIQEHIQQNQEINFIMVMKENELEQTILIGIFQEENKIYAKQSFIIESQFAFSTIKLKDVQVFLSIDKDFQFYVDEELQNRESFIGVEGQSGNTYRHLNCFNQNFMSILRFEKLYNQLLLFFLSYIVERKKRRRRGKTSLIKSFKSRFNIKSFRLIIIIIKRKVIFRWNRSCKRHRIFNFSLNSCHINNSRQYKYRIQ